MEPPKTAASDRLTTVEQTVLDIRRNSIEKTVLEILKNADMETATEHSIRTTVADRLGIDLSDLQSKVLVRKTLESFLLSTTESVAEPGNVQVQPTEVVVRGEEQRSKALPNADSVPAQDDIENCICKLSEKRRVSITEFRGKPLVSIRDFYQKDGKLLPSKNGISLTPYQWSALRSSFPDIEAAIMKVTAKISNKGTGKETEAANPTAVAALASQRNIPAERAEIEVHGKQAGIENPTLVTALISERARLEADGKQTETANPTSVTALASERQSTAERAQVEAGAASSAMTFTPRALVPIAPTRLNGKNYHCWMHQIDFFLNQLKIAYVLTDPYPGISITPEASFEETIKAKLNAQKWVDDDYICRHNILNSLDDHLFTKYSSKTYSAKELWEELKSAYDVGFMTKRSQVYKYIHFEMVDGVSVHEQVEELHKIADTIVGSGMHLDETFHVSTIISKLPSSWKQFQVKMMQEDILPLNKLMYKLKDEEEIRDRRKKEQMSENARVVNLNNDNKVGPRKFVCYICGKEGHKSMNCPRKLDSRERSTTRENDNVPVSSEVNAAEKYVK